MFFSTRKLVTRTLLTTSVLALTLPVFAQQAGLNIYRGDTVQSAGITLVPWGSGSVEETKQSAFSGSNSLKLVTHGYYQGVSLLLSKPANLEPYVGSKSAYLQVAVLPPADSNTPGGAGRAGGFPGMMGGMMGGMGGGGNPSNFMTNYMRGQGARGGAGNVTAQKNRKLQNFRLTLVTTNGRALEALLPLTSARTENGWKLLHIPVGAIPGMQADDAKIQEVRFYGDTPASVFVGKIGVVVDATPITITPVDEKYVPRNEKGTYQISAAGGATPLKYSWDFDVKDGIQEEAEGRAVTHTYYKSGDYVVTVTVSDLYGMKAPTKVTFKVHVTL